MSQPPREELLRAGKKKLKNYQQRRQSANATVLSKVDSAQLSSASWRWRAKALRIQSQDNTASESTPPTPTSAVTSPTDLHPQNSLDGYPSPPMETRTISTTISAAFQHPRPVPTASTPTTKTEEVESRLRDRKTSRHERSLSVADYSVQFPSTWAYAHSRPLRPLEKIDEALIWSQQNSRLLRENEKLKKELDEARQHTMRLAETLALTEQELQDTQLALQRAEEVHARNDTQQEQQPTHFEEREAATKEALRRARSEERARWSEIVERLEREVRALRLLQRESHAGTLGPAGPGVHNALFGNKQ